MKKPETIEGEKKKSRSEIIQSPASACHASLREITEELDLTSEPYPTTEPSPEWEKASYKQISKRSNSEKIAPRINILRDHGVVFYKVQKGDFKNRIIEKLSKQKEFRYLKYLSKRKTKSFNILNKDLHPGMWIPIPTPEKIRQLSDREFLNHCHNAITELAKDPEYGCQIAAIIEKVGEKEVLKMMLAIAKVESGGEPLGNLAYHRYEPRHKAFSYSLFHVLMEGPGLTARKKLGLTEGQLYHPKNAAKVFLGFLIEKSLLMKRTPESLFPLIKTDSDKALAKEYLKYPPGEVVSSWPKTVHRFSTFYNGSAWKEKNTRYPQELIKYYLKAEEVVENSHLGKTKLEVQLAKKIEIVQGAKTIPINRGETLKEIVKRANELSIHPPYKKSQIKRVAYRIEKYLKVMYKNNKYYTTDRVGISQDEIGPYIIFHRKDEVGFLRI